MSINFETDCITRSDGTTVCFDCDSSAFYEVKSIKGEDLSKEELSDFVKLMSKKKYGSGNKAQ